MSNLKNVSIKSQDSHSLDAWGRYRVSNPELIFETKLLNNEDYNVLWSQGLISGAGITASSPTNNNPFIDLTSTDVTAGDFVRQTFSSMYHQGGKSQRTIMGAVLELTSNTPVGCQRRVGQFNANNGFYFESDNLIVSVNIIRVGLPDTQVPQAAWNIDVMDGSGPSGIIADFSMSQSFIFDFSWGGRIRFGLQINGLVHYVHEEFNNNMNLEPIFNNPSLPLRYQMVTTGATGVCEMRILDSMVLIEGHSDPVGVNRFFFTDAIDLTASGTSYAVIGLRLQNNAIGTAVKFLKLALYSFELEYSLRWELVLNPTIAGAAPGWVSQPDSGIQIAQGNGTTNVASGGTSLDGGYVTSGDANAANTQGIAEEKEITNNILVGEDFSESVRDELWIVLTTLEDSGEVHTGIQVLEQV